MTYTPSSFTEAKAILNHVVEQVADTSQAFDTRIEQMRALSTNLGNLALNVPVGWAEWAAFVDQLALDNPADEEVQSLKREKDKVVADFLNKKASMDAKVAAVDAVP